MLEERKPVHARQVGVDEQASPGPHPVSREESLACLESRDLVAFAFQQRAQRRADVLVVIDDVDNPGRRTTRGHDRLRRRRLRLDGLLRQELLDDRHHLLQLHRLGEVNAVVTRDPGQGLRRDIPGEDHDGDRTVRCGSHAGGNLHAVRATGKVEICDDEVRLESAALDKVDPGHSSVAAVTW